MCASRIRRVLTVLVLLGPAAGVRGDAAPGPFEWSRDFDPQLRFENLADYPDFDFYLSYGRGGGKPRRGRYLTPVTSGVTVRLEGTGKRLTEVFLIAVPHGQKPPTPREDRDWLSKGAPGVLQSHALDGVEHNWSIADENDGYVLRYSVSIKDGRLVTSSLPRELLFWEWVRGRLPYLLVGLALFLVVAWVGIWVLRRLRRRKPWGDSEQLGPKPSGLG
jgi:hypothetical protein